VPSGHKRSQGSVNRVMPPKFLENKVILCFERRYPNQNSVFRRELKIFALQTFMLATLFCHVTDFYHSEFRTTCNCAEKQSCPELFHCIEMFLSSRIFEQLALALENGVCFEIFHCVGYNFYIQDF